MRCLVLPAGSVNAPAKPTFLSATMLFKKLRDSMVFAAFFLELITQ
jgi:hypothetical protein